MMLKHSYRVMARCADGIIRVYYARGDGPLDAWDRVRYAAEQDKANGLPVGEHPVAFIEAQRECRP